MRTGPLDYEVASKRLRKLHKVIITLPTVSNRFKALYYRLSVVHRVLRIIEVREPFNSKNQMKPYNE